MIALIYVLYSILVIAYFRIKRNENILNLFTSLFIPVFGFIMVYIYNNSKDEQEEKSKIIDKKYTKIKNKRLLNNVFSGFNTDLLVKNYKLAKKNMYFFNDLKLKDRCDLYNKALNCNDTEIAHFAAASLVKIKQEFESKIACDLSTFDNFVGYTINLNLYLNSNLVDGMIKESLIKEFFVKLEEYKLQKIDNKVYYQAIVNLCLISKNYEYSIEFVDYLISHWENDEKNWVYALKIAYESNNSKLFTKVIEKIEKLDLHLSKKVRNIVDLWV